MREGEEEEVTAEVELLIQQLRSKATELLLQEQWIDSVQIYTQIITLCQNGISNPTGPTQDPIRVARIRKSLCLALCNRAEARFRLRDFAESLSDCDDALKIESTHFKTLICKGKILFYLNKYSLALDCFQTALLDPQASDNLETVNGYLEKCKKLELQSKTGSFDISDWILSGFCGKSPDLAEFVGSIEIKKSEISGRGLFSTKNISVGTLVIVTKSIATERGILGVGDSAETAQLVMWKNFIEKIIESARNCPRILKLISTLSTGKDEEILKIPEMGLFDPVTEERDDCNSNQQLDVDSILSVLDVNALVEEGVSTKVLGKNRDLYGVGLWILPSFINHSCSPNARRVHVGDHVLVHASRDIKAGEEINFSYFDMFSPFQNRREMANSWGFSCKCSRCKFESCLLSKKEFREFEMGIERNIDPGSVVYMLEETMKRWALNNTEKRYMRSSYWSFYSEVFESDRLKKRWERKIPRVETIIDCVFEIAGGDERLVKVVVDGLKSNGSKSNMLEMERAMKIGKGIYGKVVMKKKAMKCLLGLQT